jgi:hypothetical protein
MRDQKLSCRNRIAPDLPNWNPRDGGTRVLLNQGFHATSDQAMPHSTRKRIARALVMLRDKHVEMPAKKHDNLPL